MFGILHPFKYTIIVSHCLFFPLVVAFSHGIVAVDTPIYTFPKLLFKERMLPCLFVVASKYKVRIQQKFVFATCLLSSPHVCIFGCRSAIG